MKSRRKINYDYHQNENKPVIVFSNSLGCDLHMWDKQFDELKNDFSILRYDVRGHGRSVPSLSSEFAMNDLCVDLIDLMDELNIQKAHFCGLSIGGFIGLWLGENFSNRFYSLTLCNTSAKISTTEGWMARIELVKKEGLDPIAEASPARWFTADFAKNNPSLVAKTTYPMKEMEKECYMQCCNLLGSLDQWSDISAIELPTLIIAGKFDLVTTVDRKSVV